MNYKSTIENDLELDRIPYVKLSNGKEPRVREMGEYTRVIRIT